jgi:hypothetical protein
MPLTGEEKILLGVVIAIIVLYIIYAQNSSESKNQNVEHLDASLSNDSDNSTASDSVSTDSVNSSMTSAPAPSVDSSSASASSGSTEQTRIRRGPNTTYAGCKASLSGCARGGAGDIDKFFISGNSENATENKEFYPADFVSDKLASYIPKKLDEGLLPVEEKDWFEDVTPTKIKNRHLINIYRPVGVNTISTSLKNPSLDLRGAPANPKQVISPFLNSSIEPDHNIKGLCV